MGQQASTSKWFSSDEITRIGGKSKIDNTFEGHERWSLMADGKEETLDDKDIIGALRTKESNGRMWPNHYESHQLSFFYKTATPGIVDIISYRRSYGFSVMRPHYKIWKAVAAKDIKVAFENHGPGHATGFVSIAKPGADANEEESAGSRDDRCVNSTSALQEGPWCGARTKTFEAATSAMKKALEGKGSDE